MRLNPSFIKRKVCFVNNTRVSSALREWEAQFSKLPTLVTLGSVAALLAILGPFNTGEMLGLVPRFAYWVVVASTTYSIGFLVNAALWPRVASRMPKPICLIVVGLATSLAITPMITLLNLISFGFWPALEQWPILLAQFLAIALSITIIFQTISGQVSNAPPAEPRVPDILARLPLDKRGALVALSSEDHHTRIRTTRGEELVLLRLADAIREATPAQVLQVYRSHWVALDQVVAVRRTGARTLLQLRMGDDIPVSRAHIAAIKQAGLLPR